MSAHNILSLYQSGVRKQHSTITAPLKVVDDIIEALEIKKTCAALFIDLYKAFDTVDHRILKQRLFNTGLSKQVVGWFENYLSERTYITVFSLASYMSRQGSPKVRSWLHFY